LSGHDAPTFLQGLTTANIPPLSTKTNGLPRSIYSAFLNAQGRILHDVFIYVIKPGDLDIGGKFGDGQTDIQILIEVDAAEQNALLKWLKRYKLRAKIQLRALDPEEIAVHSSWDESPLRSNSPDSASPSLVHYSDDRAPSFGRRILASLKSSSKQDSTNLGLPSTSESVDLPTYKLRRYLHGIPEGQSELLRESALVQESCLDYMGAVDFRKGCYVGQELVIRTQHIGVVRKRDRQRN
jgi:folate-binding protein YgfZ